MTLINVLLCHVIEIERFLVVSHGISAISKRPSVKVLHFRLDSHVKKNSNPPSSTITTISHQDCALYRTVV